jgi:MFS family permease
MRKSVSREPAPIHRPLFYGWVVVGGAFVVLFLAYGAQYAFGVFFAALLDEFGWSRASLAGAFSLYAFTYSGCGVLAGLLTDRLGPRAVIALGGGFLGLGLMAMSQVTALWQPFVLYGCVAALGMSTAYVPCNATIVRWFVDRRGLAVGIASAGGSLGTVALPPVAYLLVTTVGWRWAYVIFGGVILVGLNLVAVVMRRDPEALGLIPDGRSPGALTPGGGRAARGYTVSEAARTGAFWMVWAVFAATWIPVFVPLVHLIPFARDLGVPALWAATLVSALGIAAIAGRVIMGGLSDRIGRRGTLAAGLVLQAFAFAGFSAAQTLPALYAAAVLFGFSYGTISALFPALVSDFFGREHSGSLIGLLFALAAPMAAAGPVGAGWIYDHTGSYGLAWWLAVGCNLLALALLAFARPPATIRSPPADPRLPLVREP